MRTTVNLPEDVYEVARSLAAQRRIPLGEALAELARRGLRPQIRAAAKTKRGFPCFPVPSGAKPITLDQTLAAEDEL